MVIWLLVHGCISFSEMKLILTFLILSITNIHVVAQSTDFENNECINSLDTLDGMKVYGIVEIQPEYNGGMSKFYNEFSEIIKDTWIKQDITDSKYFYTFVIDTTGNIRNFCIVKPRGNALNKEKLKKLNNWSPGFQRGKKVPVRMMIPVIVEPG